MSDPLIMENNSQNSRNPDGTFQKGHSLTSHKRRKTAKTDLLRAIREIEKQKNKKLFQHFVERAYTDNKVLIALIKKLVPDISLSEITGADNGPVRIILERIFYGDRNGKENQGEQKL